MREEKTFVNEDGTAATWLEEVPFEERKKSALRWAGGGLLFALVVWGLQYWGGALGHDYMLFGLAGLAVGGFSGWAVYEKAAVRRYSVKEVMYSQRDRWKKSGGYFGLSVVMFAVVWGIQLSSDDGHFFREGWWYAWPALIPALVGYGLFRLKGERVLTPAAASAKKYYEEPPAPGEKKLEPTPFDRLMEHPLVRYAGAALLLYGAYYFAYEDTGKKSGWAVAGCLLWAMFLAREVSKWLLILGFGGAALWAIGAGIAALPLSAAIIIGAIIIASSK